MPRTRAMCRDDNPARRTWPVRRRGVATRCRSFGDSARHSNGARARLGHGGVQSHLTDCGMPSSVQLIRAPDLSDVEYAYAATAPQGSRLIFLAGSCPLDEHGMTVAVGDYAGQAAACVETMKGALAASGATIQDVISTRVLVASSS